MIWCKPLTRQMIFCCSPSLGLFCAFHLIILLGTCTLCFGTHAIFFAFNSSTLRFCNFLICQLGKSSGWLSCASNLGIDIFLSILDTSNSIGSNLVPCSSSTCCFTSVTPDFKTKTRCSSYVCLGSSCHTYGQNVNTENQCLYYINIITQDIVFTQKTISTLSSSSNRTHQIP
jgi:hypothetical protein